jgi:hypothetical protein
MKLWQRVGYVAFLTVAQVVVTGMLFWDSAKACPKEPEPFATPEQLDTKNSAVTQCYAQQGQPVMGFNLKVVCLEPSGKIAWVR